MKRWDPARETDPVDKTHDNSLPSDALWTIQPGTAILLSQQFFKGNFFVKTDNNNKTVLRKNYDKRSCLTLSLLQRAERFRCRDKLAFPNNLNIPSTSLVRLNHFTQFHHRILEFFL